MGAAMIRAAALLLLAAAGDPAAEAAARMKERWSTGLDAMDAAGLDAHRAALLEPVAASGSLPGFRAVLETARERASQLASFRKRLEDIAEYERKRAEEEKGRADGDKGPRPGDPGAPKSARDLERREFEEKQRAEDKEKHPGRIEREARWQEKLSAAAGSLADALPDGEFAKAAAPLLEEALGDSLDGWDDWIAAATGASRKERTARFLLDAATAATADYRKNLAARLKPSRELEKANDAINERAQKYFEQQAKQGNFTDQVPVSLLEPFYTQKLALGPEVERLSSAMDAASRRRRTAGKGLGRMLAGATDAGRESLLAMLDREALSSRDFETRCFGLFALGPCPGDRAMGTLRAAAKDPVPEVVVAALDALAVRSEAEVLDLLAAGLSDPRWQVRAAAAAGLGASGRGAAVPPLLAAMVHAEGRTVDDLQAALETLTGKSLPAVAAAWEHWWSKEGANFRGPKDPGGEAAKKEEGGAAGDGTGGEGSKVSFFGIETRSERLLFILDFSGSMNFAGSETDAKRKKIDILLEEMRKTVTGLKDGSKFNIVAFAADVRTWRKGPAERDAKTAKDAMDWVEKQPVAGSTNIYDALETAFKLMGVGAGKDKSYEPVYDTIFFMTDGTPTSGKVTDTALILGDVRRWNDGRKIRVHVIGMGGKEKGGQHGGGGGGKGDLDRKFLETLAAENQGEVVFR